jgi:hypothetical protein
MNLPQPKATSNEGTLTKYKPPTFNKPETQSTQGILIIHVA